MIVKTESPEIKVELGECFGEHQSQMFYGRIGIHYLSTVLNVKLGSVIPIDLSTIPDSVKPTNCPILCVPIHFYQRLTEQYEQTISNSLVSLCPLGYQTYKYLRNRLDKLKNQHLFEKRCDEAINNGNDSIITTSASTTTVTNPSTTTVGNVKIERSGISKLRYIALATIRVYFPVKYMTSANCLKISTDLKKRFHLAPHSHEFVAYGELITLPIEELAVCVMKALECSKQLIYHTLLLPTGFYPHKPTKSIITRSTDNSNMTNESTLHANYDLALDETDKTHFLIVSESVYNRICVIQQAAAEKIVTPRLRWSLAKTCRTRQTTFIYGIDRSDLIEQTSNCNVSYGESIQQFDLTDSQSSVELMNWVGLGVQNKLGAQKCEMNLPTQLRSNLSHDRIRVGFVRRESSECGSAIAPYFQNSKHLPAKLRRSRLRGTDYLVIKFRPTFLVSQKQKDIDSVLQPANNRPIIDECGQQQQSLTGSLYNNREHSLCILTSALNYSQNSYTSVMHSPTTLTTSSIASRVKWGALLDLSTNLRPDQSSNSCLTHTSDAVQCNTFDIINDCVDPQTTPVKESNKPKNESSNFQLIEQTHPCQTRHVEKEVTSSDGKRILQPRPRIPPKRLDMADQDLEFVLQRSLNESRMKFTKTKYVQNHVRKPISYTVCLNNNNNSKRNHKIKEHSAKSTKSHTRLHKPNLFLRVGCRNRIRSGVVTHRSPTNKCYHSAVKNKSTLKPKLFYRTLDEALSLDKVQNDQLPNKRYSPLPKLTFSKNRNGEFNVVNSTVSNVESLFFTPDNAYAINTTVVTTIKDTSTNLVISDITTGMNCSPSTNVSVNTVNTTDRISVARKRPMKVKDHIEQICPAKRPKIHTIPTPNALSSFNLKDDTNDLSVNGNDINDYCVPASQITTSQTMQPQVIDHEIGCSKLQLNVKSDLPTCLSAISTNNELNKLAHCTVNSNWCVCLDSAMNNNNNNSNNYTSSLNPITMWSRLTTPLPAPDPPINLFYTRKPINNCPSQLNYLMNNGKSRILMNMNRSQLHPQPFVVRYPQTICFTQPNPVQMSNNFPCHHDHHPHRHNEINQNLTQVISNDNPYQTTTVCNPLLCNCTENAIPNPLLLDYDKVRFTSTPIYPTPLIPIGSTTPLGSSAQPQPTSIWSVPTNAISAIQLASEPGKQTMVSVGLNQGLLANMPHFDNSMTSVDSNNNNNNNNNIVSAIRYPFTFSNQMFPQPNNSPTFLQVPVFNNSLILSAPSQWNPTSIL